MSMHFEFKIGEKAMYMSQGVGVIETIEKKEIAGSTVDFYVIQIVSSGAKLMVPTKSAMTPIRKLITHGQVNKIFEVLQSTTVIPKTTWNRRFRGMCEKLKRGTAMEVAEVF